MGGASPDNFVDKVVNVATQAISFGTLGYDGGLKAGKLTEKVGEGIKEVTGANALEKSLKQSERQFQENKARSLDDRNEEQARRDRENIQSSRTAAGSRGGLPGGGGRSINRNSNLGSDEVDFLGL